jgi:PAS domain S-box-containing protein
VNKPSYKELEEKVRKLESESLRLKRVEAELLEKQSILRDRNINLVKKSIELSDIKRELEDKNHELELTRSQLRKENIDIIRKSIELSDIMRELEDKNYYLELSRSELEAALSALQESEYRYSQLVMESPDPIISLDNIGNFLSFNPMAESMSGFSKEEVLGKHFTSVNILAKESVPKALKEFALVITGNERPPFELTIMRKDKSLLFMEANPRLIKHKGKKPWIQLIFRDITERKKLVGGAAESSRRAGNTGSGTDCGTGTSQRNPPGRNC